MKVVISQLGTICECIVSTSILKGLKKRYKNIEIDVIVADQTRSKLFSYHPLVKNVFTLQNKEEIEKKEFDLFISLDRYPYSIKIQAETTIGLGSKDFIGYYDILFGTKQSKKNLFQIYYDLAGLTWRGEGYDFYYYPHTKTQKQKTGIAIANSVLKKYVLKRLNLKQSKIWTVPNKTNIFKKADDINKCESIITDDFLTMHVASALRKYVYFLQTAPMTTKIELFSQGQLLSVPGDILRWT